MTWTAVGSAMDSGSTTITTISITTHAVGNVVLLEAINFTGDNRNPTSVSGGDCTWAAVGTPFHGTTHGWNAGVFAGTVTSVGTATATVAWQTGTPGAQEIVAREFHYTGTGWSLDTQSNFDSAGTNTWPGPAAAGSGELYFGFIGNTGTSSAGSTSGYTYFINFDGNGMAYNLSYTSSTPPVWGDSGEAFGIIVLLAETGAPSSPAPRPLIIPQAINRASAW